MVRESEEDMSRAEFSIRYQGEALEEGRMSVRDLAPALLSVADLFDAVCEELNGKSIPVDVHVLATSEGSFEVDLSVIMGLVDSIKTKVVSFVDAQSMVELVFGSSAGGLSLFALYRLLRGLRQRNVETEVELRFGKDKSVRYRRQVVMLYQNEKVRDAVGHIVKPVLQSGIDRVDFRNGDGVSTQSIAKHEAHIYKNDGAEMRLVTDETQRIAYSIHSVSFVSEGAWRLSDGNSVVTVYIEDESFLAAFHNGDIRLDASNVLICLTRVRQYTNALGKLATEHVILEVVDVREELPLFAGLPVDDQLLMAVQPSLPGSSTRRRSKYTPLRDFLLEVSDDGTNDVVLTYEEIERLLQAELPKSAYGQQTIGLWWRNDASHTQARNGWLAAGWWVQSIDRRSKRVYFTRQR